MCCSYTKTLQRKKRKCAFWHFEIAELSIYVVLIKYCLYKRTNNNYNSKFDTEILDVISSEFKATYKRL